MRTFALLCLAGTAVALSNTTQCAHSCVVNTDCGSSTNAVCGMCMERKCASGCGIPCDVDAHCGDANCPVCDATKKVCGPKAVPTPPPVTPVPAGPCGSGCSTDAECKGECTLCFGLTNTTRVGKCGAGCGQKCTLDSHCLDSNCGSCNTTTHICEHKAKKPVFAVALKNTTQCAHACVVNTDCGSSTNAVCGMCMERKCASGCGIPCDIDAHCGDMNCPVCDATKKVCGPKTAPTPPPVTPIPTGPCGSECWNDDQCAGECTVCFRNMTTYKGACGAGCQQACNKDADCLDINCVYCNTTSHQCTSAPIPPTPPPTPAPIPTGPCGSACSTDAECAAGECPLCFGLTNTTRVGKCGAGCGMKCTLDSHCLDSNCGSCNTTTHICEHKAKKSVFAVALKNTTQCAHSCVVNTDCGSSTNAVCGMCMERKCASGCGIPCDIDAHCGDTNCPVCDATKKVCGPKAVPTPPPVTPVPAGPCGSGCSTDAECKGECTLCFGLTNTTRVGKCGAGCGQKCTLDSHCLDSNCGSCNTTTHICEHKAKKSWSLF